MRAEKGTLGAERGMRAEVMGAEREQGQRLGVVKGIRAEAGS